MKHLPLKNTNHIRLEKAFKEWLEITGYAPSSVYNMPLCTREFLHHLEQEEKALEKLTSKDINHYFFQLKERKHQRKAGSISMGYLHKHLQAVRCFGRYLRETGQGNFETDIILPWQKSKLPEVLTRKEISELYKACENTPYGLRDRAMLAVFYGCGLRRNEGVGLDVSDFLKGQNLLFVRKGKNYKERYVPLTSEVKQDLQDYLQIGRVAFLRDLSEQAFFISERGRRIDGQSLMLRLKLLLQKAGITKETGLHSLRHSIATHLLQSGMKLNNISRFLGHSSIESTQIYTHLL